MANKRLIQILVLGLFAHLLIMNLVFIGNDEGNYLSDANLVLDGQIPFADFYSRSPVFIYVLAASEALFGNTLFAGRIVSILAALTTAAILYKIGRELANEKTGLIAAAAYTFAPFSLFNNTQVMGGSLQLMFLTLAFYFTIKQEKTKNTIYSGIALAAAILTRRSALIHLLTIPYLLLKKSKKYHTPIFYIVVIGVLFWPIVYFMSAAGVEQFTYIYLGSRVEQASTLDLYAESKAALFGWAFLLGEHTFSLILLISALALAVNQTKKLEPKRVTAVVAITWIIIFYMVLFLCIGNIDNLSGTTQRALESHKIFAFTLPLALYTLMVFFTEALTFFHETKTTIKSTKPYVMPLTWLIGTILFYLAFSHLAWRDYYYIELLPPITLLFSLAVNEINFKDLTKTNLKRTKLLATMLIFTFILSLVVTLTYEPTDALHVSEARIVKNILLSDTEDAEVFTATTPYTYLSGKTLMLNITHPVFYRAYDDESMAKRGMPTRTEIINYIKDNDVKYIITDPYTEYCYADIIDEIKQGYYLKVTINDKIRIYTNTVE